MIVRSITTLLFAALVATRAGAGTTADGVPLYTNEDLDRMFGPPPKGPSVPVDKSGPEDWRWVEQYIDRQYARIDADRQYDLDRYSVETNRYIAAGYGGYYGGAAWGLGYPASTWWNHVWPHYAASTYTPARGMWSNSARPGFQGHAAAWSNRSMASAMRGANAPRGR